MPLTHEQYELRYTKQRILKALTDEPYGVTTRAAVRSYTLKHSDERFAEAVQALIAEGWIEEVPDDRLSLTWRYTKEQAEKEKKAAAAERAKKKAERDARKVAREKSQQQQQEEGTR